MERNGTELNNKADIRGGIKRHLVTLGFPVGIFMVLFSLVVILTSNAQEQPVQAQPESSNQTETVVNIELAKLIILEGSPRTKMDSRDFQDGFEGQLLFSGTKLRTDSKSKAMLVFNDKNSLSLDFSTLVSLEKTDLGGVVITLESGRIWHRFPVRPLTSYLTAAVFADSEINEGSLLIVQNVNTYLHAVNEPLKIKVLGKFDIELKEGEEIYVSEAEREYFQTNNTASLIKEFSGERDEWYKFNQCLDIIMPELVRDTSGLENLYTVIKQRIHSLDNCEEILGLATVKTETTSFNLPVLYPKSPTGTKATLTMASAAFNEQEQMLCNWDATGTITGYEYSLWRKLTDGSFVLVKDWIQTTNKSVNAGTATDLGMVDDWSYICRVRALSNFGNSEKDSNVVIYDEATGTLNVNNPAPNYQSQVDGTGQFVDADIADLQIRFKIQNDDPASANNTKYCNDDNNWVGNETWFEANLTELLPGQFNFENFDITCGDPDKVGKFTIQLRNTKSGKVLNYLEFPVMLTITP